MASGRAVQLSRRFPVELLTGASELKAWSTTHTRRNQFPWSQFGVSEEGVVFENLESHDPEVVSFFTEMPVESLGDLAGRAMTVGVLGLRAMGTAGRMEIVEKEFLALSQRFASSLEGVERRLTDKVDRTFDPDRAESVSARLSHTIAQANRATTATIDDAKAQLQQLIGDLFNPSSPRAACSRSSGSWTKRAGRLIALSTPPSRAAISPGWSPR